MIKKIFSPNSYAFWVFSGFLGFFFFYRTPQVDLVHLSKLALDFVILLIVLIYFILKHNIDYKNLRKDVELRYISISVFLYAMWITLTNTVFSSAPSYTLLGWQDWFSGYFLYMLLLFFFSFPAFATKLYNFDFAINFSFWFSSLAALLCGLEYLGFNILLTNATLQKVLNYKFSFDTASFPVLAVGNSGYIGSLWLILLPFPFFLIQRQRFRQAYMWWLMLSLGLAATHSKISIIIAALFFLAVILYFLKNSPVAVFNIFIYLAITVFGTQAFQSANNILYSHEIVNRSMKQNFDVARSLRDRFYIWEGATNAWKARPLTGWGLETLQNTFFDYVSQETLDYYGKIFASRKENESTRHFGNLLVIVPKTGKPVQLRRAFTSNVKPHNYFIEELYSNGIIGLALLLLFLTLVTMYCIRSRSTESKLILLGFGMYLIYLCGWFITIAVSPIAFIFLGFAVHLAAQKRAQDRELFHTDPKLPLPDILQI